MSRAATIAYIARSDSLDLGRPEGREAGHLHPAVVITAQRILDARPTVIQVP